MLFPDLDEALTILSREDPSLRVSSDPDTGQVNTYNYLSPFLSLFDRLYFLEWVSSI